MTEEQSSIHKEALQIVASYFRDEARLIHILREAEKTLLFKALGKRSLFLYAHQILELSEPVAYLFNTVARKSLRVPEIFDAIQSGRQSVPECGRLVSAITPENARELIAFAENHTTREVDFEVGRRNPKSGSRDRLKILSENEIQLTSILDPEALKMFERAKELLSEKQGFENQFGFVLKSALRALLRQIDPLQKAERAAARRQKKSQLPNVESIEPFVPRTHELSPDLCTDRDAPITPAKRRPLPAATKNFVRLRDRCQCTFRQESGERCTATRWLDIHHIIPLSEGGSDAPENLILLCGFHHDLVHQLEFSLEA